MNSEMKKFCFKINYDFIYANKLWLRHELMIGATAV